MALGTNTLGLLFKIGVDPGDGLAGFRQLMATNSEFRKGVEEGVKAEMQAFAGLKTSLQTTNDSAKQLGITFNQARIAIGQLLGGLTLARAFREIGQALEEIGTRSKDTFEELQKQVESAGGHITALQRNIAQELLDAFDKLKGASKGFMAEVIETSGPALINLLKDIAKWLKDLRPLAKAIGDDLADTFSRLEAMGRTILELRERQAVKQPGVGESILEAIFPPLAAKRALADMNTFDEAYARHLKNVTEENKKFVAKNAGEDADKTKKARKDLTDAALAQAEAENALTLVRQDAAIADKQINEDQAKGLITQAEGAKRRLAVLAELQKAETAVLDAREKAVRTDPTLLQNQRLKQLNDIETQRAVLRTQAAEAEREENEKTIAADKKLHDAFAAHFAKLKLEWIDYAKFIHKIADEIVQDIARQAQPVPGGGGVGPIPGAPPGIALPAPAAAIKDLSDLLARLHKQMVQNIDDAIAAGGAWGGFTQSLKEFFSLKNIGDQFVLMMQSVLDVFIQTGHTGPAVLRQLVAGVLRAIATMSAEWGTFFLLMAVGFAALGDWSDAAKFALAGAGLWALAAGLGFAASKVGPSQAGAAAGAGGFGGTSADGTPSPVNIALGGGGATSLAISNAQFARAQIDAINNLNNKLASMSPGDVVTVAADQKPEAFAAGTLEAGRRNGAFTREFMQISGART